MANPVFTMRHDAAPVDALMVFDGVCNLCSASVRLVTRMDPDGRIRFTSIQSPYGQELCRRAGVDPSDPATFLFFDQGRALQASDAIVAMMARLPRPWCWLRAAALIPRPLRDALYLWLARNRYRLFGRRQTCMIPSPELMARFVDHTPSR